MGAVVLNEKLAKSAIREYINLQKAINASLIEAAHISNQLDIPYELVKKIFHELAQEGFLSSIEYLPG